MVWISFDCVVTIDRITPIVKVTNNIKRVVLRMLLCMAIIRSLIERVMEEWVDLFSAIELIMR
jgi:hypothetical protein